MKDKKYLGNYLGIVVQNNDPEKRGRVKVFIPHISISLYENWSDLDENNSPTNRQFRFPGSNIQGDLTKPLLDKLKDELPWAECALPLVGESASGRFWAHEDEASISDTNKVATFTPGTSAATENTSEVLLNLDNIGESIGKKYELQKLKLYDAFTGSLSGSFNQPNRANVFGYNYTPNTYSNKSKGAFGIPNVGAHVWCFFREGSATDPVYWASSHGAEDWKAIYDCHDEEGIDYPGTFENKSNSKDETYDVNTETYRNKFVINQKGGALEFVNTDQKEVLKMTHYSGSFKEFNNHANIELAAQHDQKLVLEDQFSTVRGYGNYYIGRDSDNLIKGDQYIKIGKLEAGLHHNWKEIARDIADVKQLFEHQRAEDFHAEQDVAYASDPKTNKPVIYRRVGKGQKKQGGTSGLGPVVGADCPVCRSVEFADYYHHLNNQFNSVGVSITKSSGAGGNSPTDQWSSADGFTDVSINGNDTTRQAQYMQALGEGTIFDTQCPVCNGYGFSPSSMNANWAIDPKKKIGAVQNPEKENFESIVLGATEKLKDIEKQMGRGGSQIVNIAKHKVESIGLSMNDFGSIRVDNKGKIYRDSVIVHPLGVFNSQKESPLVEYVHVDDLPGGTYTLNVCNRWNVQVGAGGVSMKSYGPVDIGGTIVNMSGEQVNVTSQSEVNIDGGKRLTLVADILSIRQRNRKQVLIDSNLGVSQNVVIGGGAHIEGELTVNHVTAPCEIQETELASVFAKLLSGLSFKCNLNGGSHAVSPHGTSHPSWSGATLTLTADSNDDKVQCYDHSHHFKNLPLHLKKTNEGVRSVAARCNTEKRSRPEAIQEVRAQDKVTSS